MSLAGHGEPMTLSILNPLINPTITVNYSRVL